MPETYTQVHTFCRITGHYRRFIKGFINIRKKEYRDETNDRNRINKAFEKINRFNGSNPDQC